MKSQKSQTTVFFLVLPYDKTTQQHKVSLFVPYVTVRGPSDVRLSGVGHAEAESPACPGSSEFGPSEWDARWVIPSVGPPLTPNVCWLTWGPHENYSYLHTINYSEMGAMRTNLANELGPHLVVYSRYPLVVKHGNGKFRLVTILLGLPFRNQT